jgi:hypothetical protein
MKFNILGAGKRLRIIAFFLDCIGHPCGAAPNTADSTGFRRERFIDSASGYKPETTREPSHGSARTWVSDPAERLPCSHVHVGSGSEAPARNTVRRRDSNTASGSDDQCPNKWY